MIQPNMPGATNWYKAKAGLLSGSSTTMPVNNPAPPSSGPTTMGGYVMNKAQSVFNAPAPSPAPQVSRPGGFYGTAPSPVPSSWKNPAAGNFNAPPAPSYQAKAQAASSPYDLAAPVQPIAETVYRAPAAPPPQAGQPGSTLQDPGQITDAGKLYAQRVLQNLQGNNPLIQNAQATEDTAAARREYMARKDTTESLAQTPYGPATAQYQRAMDQAQAGVDSANQQGQIGVNAFTRQTTADNMAAANNLEDQQYGRAVGERTNSQMQTQNLADSIQDPKAKYAYNRMVQSGMDPKSAYDAVVGQNGSINPQYQSSSPGTLDVKASQDAATSWIQATRPDLKPGTPEFQKAVTDRMQATDKAIQAPVTAANQQQDLQTAKSVLANNPSQLTPDQAKALISSGDIPSLSMGDATNSVNKMASLVGKTVNLDGQIVKVAGRGDYAWDRTSVGSRHSTYVEIQMNGKSYWADNAGYWYDHKPQDDQPKGYRSIPNPLKGQ
jgi:hypothetical protein